ncbi:MAG: hypothetical protein QNI99_08925 [Woeseiaceae bacterium]|nr:hypothetical protein [Woeseiaceae bacterium]
MSEYVLVSSVLVGAFLLVFLAYQDFRNQIFKPVHAGRYYAGMIVFLIFNLFIYVGLCAFFLGIDLLQPATIMDELQTGTESPVRVLQPLLLAVLYHATGMAPFFKVGGEQTNLYKLLLQSFQEFLKLRFASSVQIREAIAEADAELSMLGSKADLLRQEAEKQKWDTLDDRWREVKDDLELLKTQSEYLTGLKETVEQVGEDPKELSRLTRLATDIDARIEKIRGSQIRKLKRYLSDFVLMNFKDEKEIRQFLEGLGIEFPNGPTPERRFALRCMFVGFAFGLAFGPLFAFTTEGVNAVVYARYGALSLGVFGFMLGVTRDLWKTPGDRSLLAIGSGAIAGLFGHMTWNLVTNEAHVLVNIEIGIAVGIVLSLLVYVFRLLYDFRKYKLPAWMTKTATRLVLTALAGGGVMALIGVAFAPDDIAVMGVVRLSLLGAIAMWALATGFRIFEKRGERPRTPSDTFGARPAAG